jgi:hypothetical protein
MLTRKRELTFQMNISTPSSGSERACCLIHTVTFLEVPSFATIFCFKCFYFLISFYLYPLYVSAPMGHPQVEYTTTQSSEATADRLFMLGYTIIIYIYPF